MNYQIHLALILLTVSIFWTNKTPAAVQSEENNPLPTTISNTSLPVLSLQNVNTNKNGVTEQIEQLRTADEGKRRRIIQELSDNQQNIVPELIKAMSDSDPNVKSAAAEILGNLTDTAVPAIPALIEMTSSTQRVMVPKSSEYSSPVISHIRPIPIQGSNTRERRIPPDPPLNPDNLLRITAIVSLGKIGSPARTAATPVLTQALQDPDPWVKLNAIWALSEIGTSTPLLTHWLEALQNPSFELRRSAAQIFIDDGSLLPKIFSTEADTNTAAPLLKALKDGDLTVLFAASSGLKLLGAKALPELIKSLKASDPFMRLKTAEILGYIGIEAQPAVSSLLELLQDTERYVESPFDIELAAIVPGRIPSLSASSSRDYVTQPRNPEKLIRVNAAIALGKIGDRKAIPGLTTSLKDKSPWMQLASAWALLKLEQNQSLPVMGQLLQNPNASVQLGALSILRAYGSQSVPYLIPYYKKQLDSTKDSERNEAIMRIGEMGVAALDLVPKLRTLLTSNKKDSSGYAATIIGQIAQDTASALANNKLSPQQRQKAIAEFTKVLQIMQAPKAQFNSEPQERVRNALNTLFNKN